MIKVFYSDSYSELEKNVSCIGFFDGVHTGHQKLISRTIQDAKKKGLKAYAITFSCDPLTLIKGPQKQISDLNDRFELFERFGLDGVIVLNFTAEMMQLDHKEFVKKYLLNMKIEEIVCGFDFHYGFKGLGSAETLKDDGESSFDSVIIDQQSIDGIKVSSTLIKQCLEKGDVHKANELLGYTYFIHGYNSNSPLKEGKYLTSDKTVIYYSSAMADSSRIELISRIEDDTCHH